MGLSDRRRLIIGTKDVEHVNRLTKKYSFEIDDRNLDISVDKKTDAETTLIGYDGETKKVYTDFDETVLLDVFRMIDQMPMRKYDHQLGGKINGRLYTDDNPEHTIKGVGYRDKKRALKTLDLIKNRSIKYQKITVIALYNRAKYHKHRTSEMEEAMAVFKKWLDKNRGRRRKYPYLALDIVNSIISADKTNNFLKMYKKVKRPDRLSFIPVSKPEGQDYDSKREQHIENRLSKGVKLYHKNGEITKEHLDLIMYAYSPDKRLNQNL